jgi:hypothetical protein
MSFLSAGACNPSGPLLPPVYIGDMCWGFGSRCHNDIFTCGFSLLLVSLVCSLSQPSISLHTQKFLANGALCRSHAHNSKFRPISLENSAVLGLFCAPLSHANLEACAWACAKSLLLLLLSLSLSLLILISSAFRNLREIKVVCGRTYVRSPARAHSTAFLYADSKKCLNLMRLCGTPFTAIHAHQKRLSKSTKIAFAWKLKRLSFSLL